MIRLTHSVVFTTRRWERCRHFSVLAIVSIARTDSILCRFRRMQHIAGLSLGCALCTCSPTIASRKYVQKQKIKVAEEAKTSLGMHHFCENSSMGPKVQTIHKLCINKRRERRKGKHAKRLDRKKYDKK